MHRTALSRVIRLAKCAPVTNLQHRHRSLSSTTSVLYDIPLSSRARAVEPFKVMEMMREASKLESQLSSRGGSRVLHLEVGEPATCAPAPVAAAAIDALRGPPLGYTNALGEFSLRSKIASNYAKKYQIEIEPVQVAVTSGSSAAFVAIFSACFDVGDRVAVAVPGYPCYRNILRALGINVAEVQVSRTDGYQMTVEKLQREIERNGPLQGLVVASPSNPTGTVLSKEDMRKLVELCEENGIRYISDEIYHGIVREPATCALELSDAPIVVNSFSKYYSMTGYRLGWVLTRDVNTMQALERLLQNLYISPPTLSQRAALAAFDCEAELDAHVKRYFANLDALVAALPKMGFEELYTPDGAFYMYACCKRILHELDLSSSMELCKLFLKEAYVAITPGVDFDPARGHEYVRFSCAGETEDIVLACERVEAWLKREKERLRE